MSVSVYTKDQISRSPINESTSKQMYSFSRAERFPSKKGGNDLFYNIPAGTMTRYASFGIGNRSDFTKQQKGMNPEFYSVKRAFDLDNPQGKKFSFGINRDYYAKVYYETNKMVDKQIPGPGKYNFLKNLGYDAPKFTMTERFHNKSRGNGSGYVNTTPGPGSYPPKIEINEKGLYPSSRIKNISRIDFGADKSTRFNYNYNKNPGPNAYTLNSLMGKNFNSKYHSSQDKSMLARYKDYDSRHNYPGPGQYRAFSEFGIYESKNASEIDKQRAQTQQSEKKQKTTASNYGDETKPTEKKRPEPITTS